MQHLIRGDVVQHHGDRLRCVQSRRDGDKLALGHAHVLRVAPVDGHGGDCLAQFEVSHAFAELIDGSDEIPTRRVGHARRFGMDALARQDVRQTDPRRQHLHSYLACFRGRNVFFDRGDHFRAAVVSDDNSLLAHVPDLWPAISGPQAVKAVLPIPETPPGFGSKARTVLRGA